MSEAPLLVGNASGRDVSLPCAGCMKSLLLSSGNPKEVKSVSFKGGAGADGDIVAFRGMGSGGLEEGGRTRVGAVDPDSSVLRAVLLDVDGEPSNPATDFASLF